MNNFYPIPGPPKTDLPSQSDTKKLSDVILSPCTTQSNDNDILYIENIIKTYMY